MFQRTLVICALVLGIAVAQTKRGDETIDPKAKAPTKPVPNIEVDAPTGATPPSGTLVVAVPQLPELMSPTLAHSESERAALDLLYEPLVRPVYDSQTGRGYEAGLAAELPRMVVRGREVKLKDATWSDGTPVTSADVRSSLEKLRVHGSVDSDAIEAIHADAPDRCRVLFKSGTVDPLTLLTFKLLPAAHADDEAFARAPVGCGPFVYEGRKNKNGRTYAVFNANPAYAKRVPNKPRLAAVWMVASRSPASDFRAGKVHFALTERTPELRAQVAAAQPAGDEQPTARLVVEFGGGNLGAILSRRIYYLAVNHRHPAFTDATVRQLIAYAIPRDAILTSVLRSGYLGHHKPLDGPFPPNSWPCSPLSVTLDDANLARALAGSRKGRDVAELTLRFPADDGLIERACEQIVAAFGDGSTYGVRLRKGPLPADGYERRIDRDTDFHLAFRHFDYDDEWFNPADLLGPRGRQTSGYRPTTNFDRLLARTESRRDFGELRRAMQQLHAEFRQEMPFVPLWALDVHAMTAGRLTTDPLPSQLDPLAPFTRIANWTMR